MRHGRNDLEVGVVERGGNAWQGGRPAASQVAQLHRKVDGRRLEIRRERRFPEEVADLHLRRREQHHVAVDAGVAEEVLVLKEGSVAPAVHLHREQVLARLQVLGDVELVRGAAVLGVADLHSVHPHVVRRIHALEAQEHGASLPSVRHGERAAVGRYGIVIRARIRRRPRMRIRDVRVDRDAKPLQLHAARHVDLIPAGIVVADAVELVAGALLVGAAPVVLPFPVERLDIRRLGEVGCERGLLGRERERIRARGFDVHVVDEFVLPFERAFPSALLPDLGDRRLAHVRPLRAVVDAQVLPLKASGGLRDGLQVFVNEEPERGLRALHVRAVDADDAVAHADRPRALGVPWLCRDKDVSALRGVVALDLHGDAGDALHLAGEFVDHRLRGGCLVRSPVDAERPRVVSLDRERVGEKSCRRRKNENGQSLHSAHSPRT